MKALNAVMIINIKTIMTRHMGERANLNEPWLALEQPFGVWIAAPDRVVARCRL